MSLEDARVGMPTESGQESHKHKVTQRPTKFRLFHRADQSRDKNTFEHDVLIKLDYKPTKKSGEDNAR